MIDEEKIVGASVNDDYPLTVCHVRVYEKKICGIICDFFFRKKKLFFWNNLWNNCHVTIGYFFWAMASWQLAKSQ